MLNILTASPPHSLLRAIVAALNNRFYGLESLALASICEAPAAKQKHHHACRAIPLYAETEQQKLALARLWIRAWRASRVSFEAPCRAVGTATYIARITGRLRDSQDDFLPINRNWTTFQFEILVAASYLGSVSRKPMSSKETPACEAASCRSCLAAIGRIATVVARPNDPILISISCINCGSDALEVIDPNTDPVFQARKGYYRASTLAALNDAEQNPMALIAAEHTAQLNAAQADEVFSKAEEYELLFQDIDPGTGNDRLGRTAIDILSCTTTMEVGIDIGALSGVALRNMPPARANYQQRAGRAGRRGTAIATVIAFGSADSHDEHYFQHPDQMIRGEVADPTLNVDNPDIARRHVTAFLLQRYHTDRLPEISSEEQPHLFAVLGTVGNFRNTDSELNLPDFRQYLIDNKVGLRDELDEWLPNQLNADERNAILHDFAEYTGEQVAGAIVIDEVPGATTSSVDVSDDAGGEDAAEEGEEQPTNDPGSQNLLDRLLFKGILPRYAFPTDVATFHVFNAVESTRFRPVFQYSPSQGLTTALSQYAPGKQVWIDNRLWTSGAIYSVMSQERSQAWDAREFYLECSVCHYSQRVAVSQAEKGDVHDCLACGTPESLGPARYWMRPPGFAHPIQVEEGTSPDDQPSQSYATRAKLTAPITSGDTRWKKFNDQVQSLYLRDLLLVTNRGPKTKGYNYCTKCGRGGAGHLVSPRLWAAHQKPFPMEKDQACAGGLTATGIVFGTEFITDVLLLAIATPVPLSLKPGLLSTDVALRTVSEALASSACELLELEHSELQAEYRPALSEGGRLGREAEIYI